MLTQEKLKEMLRYDESTGVFTWRTPRPRVKVGDNAGCTNARGYCMIETGCKAYGAHRLVWLYVHGEFPPDQIDHINGIKTDNRLVNLRAVTNAQNSQNRKTQKSVSCHRGVCWSKEKGKWVVRTRLNNVLHFRGYFANLDDAVLAAKSQRDELYTHHTC